MTKTGKTRKTLKVSSKQLSVSAPTAQKAHLYDKDFYQWTRTQANLLKKNQLTELDITNLIEEIVSLGKQ